MKRVCIFCGSNEGTRPAYKTSARRTGEALARRGLGLVFGGGHIGLMGAAADAALQAGGEVIGVIPQALVDRELAHRGLSDLHVVSSMHERKATMAALSDAFIALPGGYGTLDELCEILTWAQLGLHAKPCGLLDVEGYYDHLLALLDHAVAQRFLRPEHRALLLDDTDPDRLLDRLTAYQPPALYKWIDQDET
ncbi:MAG: TIGR00730 family Rossman fold protein [Armatimonadetes bacterium]|nr:TIGR00730 family Rossman fold protein [Armatimonadota bacterium]